MKILLILILVFYTSCTTFKKPSKDKLTIIDTSYTIVLFDSSGHKDTTYHAVREYYVHEEEKKTVLVSLLLIFGAIIYIIFKIH